MPIINQTEALKLIKDNHIEKAFVPILDDSQKLKSLTKRLPASPGVVSGLVAFDFEGINRIKKIISKSLQYGSISYENSMETSIRGINIILILLSIIISPFFKPTTLINSGNK